MCPPFENLVQSLNPSTLRLAAGEKWHNWAQTLISGNVRFGSFATDALSASIEKWSLAMYASHAFEAFSQFKTREN
jgi:hypothetical protein